jgi:SNF2 family DNA or RNA helicase
MHCSWERKRDLEKFDHSTQLGSARGKINRYIQSQVIALGDDWKLVLEEGRQAASTPAGHHGHYSHTPAAEGKSGEAKPGDDDNEGSNDSDKDEEEYFSPLHLEVDRILGCDENELDMNVLARQRALNLRAEKEALRKRELEDEEEEKWLKGESPEAADAMKVDGENVNAFADIEQMEKDGTWDPEDNVRYIVRWKGLQLTEATWEYWIDIKRDFVDEVEDFWRRQQAPSDKLVKEISGAPHPHPRSFRKLTESPVFGVSTADRPIAKLNDGQDGEIDAISDSDTGSVLKLRAYQLEGVNWLLWNWYNRRSCILADEMGLG